MTRHRKNGPAPPSKRVNADPSLIARDENPPPPVSPAPNFPMERNPQSSEASAPNPGPKFFTPAGAVKTGISRKPNSCSAKRGIASTDIVSAKNNFFTAYSKKTSSYLDLSKNKDK
jgi:hypothetical protein